VTYFSNFGTPLINISGTAEDTKLKLCMRIDGKGYYTKEMKKQVKRRRDLGHVTYFSNFGTPQYGMAEDTNLEFCMRIESKGY